MTDEGDKTTGDREPPDARETSGERDAPSEREDRDDDPIRALLKRSAAKQDYAPPPDIVRKVQRRIRQRSKGKFFADGWSTTQSRVNYALVAIIMLVLVALVYFALGPTGIAPH
jgi:hypothetical protein